MWFITTWVSDAGARKIKGTNQKDRKGLEIIFGNMYIEDINGKIGVYKYKASTKKIGKVYGNILKYLG